MESPNEKNLILDGIAASEAVDRSGERLSIKGTDVSTYNEGAPLSLEHRDVRLPENVLGKVFYAKKIFSPEDCDDERQLMYWNKVKLPYVYIKASLYDHSGHPQAVAVAAQLRDGMYNKEPFLPKFSVEGKVLERKGNELTKSLLKVLTVTFSPCNATAVVGGVLYDPNAPKDFKTDYTEKTKDEQSYLDDLTSKSLDIPQDFTLSNGIGASIDFDVLNLAKALEAGGGNVAPSNLTQGAALATESLTKKKERLSELSKRAAAVFRDWDRVLDIVPLLKHKLPDADEGLLNHFKNLADDIKIGGGVAKYLQKMEDVINDLKKAHEMPHAVVSSPLHGDHTYNMRPEQHELIHGLDLNDKTYGSSNWKKHPTSGKMMYVKSPYPEEHAQFEGAYSNVGRDFFGMGPHLPNVAVFNHPETNRKHVATEDFQGAKHYDKSNPEHVNKLKELHQNGTLDKITAMDFVLGEGDRNPSNFMMSPDSSGIKLIDHEDSFMPNGEMYDSPPVYGYRQKTAVSTSTPHPSLYPWLKGFKVSELKRHLENNQIPEPLANDAVNRFVHLKKELGKNPNRSMDQIMNNALEGAMSNAK